MSDIEELANRDWILEDGDLCHSKHKYTITKDEGHALGNDVQYKYILYNKGGVILAHEDSRVLMACTTQLLDTSIPEIEKFADKYSWDIIYDRYSFIIATTVINDNSLTINQLLTIKDSKLGWSYQVYANGDALSTTKHTDPESAYLELQVWLGDDGDDGDEYVAMISSKMSKFANKSKHRHVHIAGCDKEDRPHVCVDVDNLTFVIHEVGKKDYTAACYHNDSDNASGCSATSPKKALKEIIRYNTDRKMARFLKKRPTWKLVGREAVITKGTQTTTISPQWGDGCVKYKASVQTGDLQVIGRSAYYTPKQALKNIKASIKDLK